MFVRKISITDKLKGTPDAQRFMKNAAVKDAAQHNEGYLDIPFIEKYPGATLLYDHIRKGQITPEYIRKLKTDDLIYIAGHTEPNSELKPDDMSRVKANAIRAQQEIERRSRTKSLLITAIITFTAAFLGPGQDKLLRR